MSGNFSRRIWSFVVGGILAAIFVVIGIVGMDNDGLWGGIVLAVVSFTFSSCLILKNNVIPDTMLDVISWGFVEMPNFFIEADLDGIFWYFVTRIIFRLISVILGIVLAILSVVVGAVCSVFVYPYALVKNIRNGETL